MATTVGQASIQFEADTTAVSDDLVKALDKALVKVDQMLSNLASNVESTAGDAGDSIAEGVEDGAGRADTSLKGVGKGSFSGVEAAAKAAGDTVASEMGGAASKADSDLSGVDGDGMAGVRNAAAQASSKIVSDMSAAAGRADGDLAAVDGGGFSGVMSAAQRASNSVAADMSNAASKADSSLDEISQSAQENATKTENSWGDALDGLGGKVAAVAGPLAGLLGGGALASAGTGTAAEIGRMNRQLGNTGTAADAAAEQVHEAMRNGVTGSAEEAALAVGQISTTFDGVGEMGGQAAADLADNFGAFADTFQVDVAEAVSTAGVMMNSGLAGSAEEAADLMTAALQKVPQALQGEVIDATNEYSKHFANLGLSGAESMQLLADAAEGGQYAVDKTGDAIKEFSVLAVDPAKAEAFESIGLNAEEAAAKVAGGGDGAREALQETAQALLDIEDPGQRAATAIELFGAPVEDLGVDNIPKFLESLTGLDGGLTDVEGSSQALADQMANSLQGRMETLTGTVSSLAGEAFMRLWDALEYDVIPAFQEVGQWVQDNEAWIKPLITVVGILAGAYGLLALQQRIMTAGGLVKWIQQITNLTRIQTGVQAAFNLVANANPLFKVVTILAVVGGALWTFFTKTETGRQMWETFTTALGSAWDWISQKLGAGWAWLSETFTNLWIGLQEAWATWGQPVVDWIGGVFRWLGDFLGTVFRLIGAAWQVFTTALGMAWEAWGQPVVDWVANAFSWLGDGISAALQWVQDRWNDAWTWVQNIWAQHGQPVIDKVSYAFNWVRFQIDKALYYIRGYIGLAGAKIRELWAEYVQPMVDNVTDGFNNLLDTIKGWKDNVIGWFSDAGTWLLDAGKNIVDGLINGVKSMGNRVKETFSNLLPDWVKDPFKEALDIHSPSRVFAGYGVNIGEGVILGIKSIRAQVQAEATGLADAAAAAASATPPETAANAPLAASRATNGPTLDLTDATPETDALNTALTNLGTNAVEQTAGIITPAWNAMTTNMANAQAGVITPTAQAVEASTNAMGATTLANVNGVVNPSWAFMAATLQALQAGSLSPTMLRVEGSARAMAAQFVAQVYSVIIPAWSAMAAHLHSVQVGSVDPVFSNLVGGLRWVVDSFTWAVGLISSQWDQIREATARPVRFTISSVFNDGLVGMWNSVADMIGTDRMGTYPVRFASGGMMPGYTPGRDVHRFWSPTAGGLELSGGEPVMRPEFGRVVGSDWVDGANAAARMGGTKGVQRFLDASVGSFASGGIIGSITGLVNKYWPMMSITSTLRNTNDHHGAGRAVDFSNSTDTTPEMQAATGWFAQNYGNVLLELIHSPSPFNIKDGRSVGDGFGFYGAGTMNGHRNHVHVAAPFPLPGPGDPSLFGAGSIAPVDWGDLMRSWVKDDLTKIQSAIDASPFPGLVGQVPQAVYDSLRDPFLDTMTEAMKASMMPAGGESVERWRPLAMQALARHGYDPAAHIDAMMQQIRIESGGDPTAVNLVDSNAAIGTPSGGLLQVIDPTYRRVRAAYPQAFEGLPDDRFFPLTNLTAGVGAVRMDWGGPAGRWPTTGGYHLGGLLGEGEGWFRKTAIEPERVLSPRQTRSFEELVGWLDEAPEARLGAGRAGTGGAYGQGRHTREVHVTQNIIGGDAERTANKVEDRLLSLIV